MFGKIKICAGFVLWTACVLFFYGAGFCTAFLLAVGAHEMGHIAALTFFDISVEMIEFGVGGARILYRGYTTGYMKDAVIAASGPMMSLIFAAAAASLGRIFLRDWWYTAAGISAVLFAFNMLPVSVLDGGGVIRALMLKAGKEDSAYTVGKILDAITCGAIFIFGIWAMFRGSLTVIICAFCVMYACCKKSGNGVKF